MIPPAFEGNGGAEGFRPEEGRDFSPQTGAMPDDFRTASAATGWIWIGISAAVLAAGLFIAIKKKL